ncbi:MAG: hypothetical protein JWO64_239 [Hyphomicrobiales bacterium]|jgi:hypothetical protein|nr:hypothetical protein [Hyphomicrobiales bacterium]
MNEMSFFRDRRRPARRPARSFSDTVLAFLISEGFASGSACLAQNPQDPGNGCAAATGGRSLGIEADGPSRRGSQDGGQSSSRTVREQSRAFSPRLRAQRPDVHPHICVTGFPSGLLRPPPPHSRCALTPGQDRPRDCVRIPIPHICHVPASAGNVDRPRARARSQPTSPDPARRENKSLTWPTKC